MKKALALLVALMLVFSLSTMAFAADEDAAIDVTAAVENAVDNIENEINVDANVLDTIEGAAVNVIDALSKFDLRAFDADSVAGIVDDFRDVLASVGVDTSSGTVANIVDNLKQKVKDWYGRDVADPEPQEPEEEEPVIEDTPVEEEPVAPAETGSSATAGIACFAAVSVAAAAAFVCTKKKA